VLAVLLFFYGWWSARVKATDQIKEPPVTVA
jgi:hypothetical protein